MLYYMYNFGYLCIHTGERAHSFYSILKTFYNPKMAKKHFFIEYNLNTLLGITYQALLTWPLPIALIFSFTVFLVASVLHPHFIFCRHIKVLSFFLHHSSMDSLEHLLVFNLHVFAHDVLAALSSQSFFFLLTPPFNWFAGCLLIFFWFVFGFIFWQGRLALR